MALAAYDLEASIAGTTRIKDADDAIQKNMLGVKHWMNGTDGTGETPSVSNYTGVGLKDYAEELAIQEATRFSYSYNSTTKTLTITDI